jgi:hypothetical protein
MPKGVLLSVESSRVLRPHLKRLAVDRQVSKEVRGNRILAPARQHHHSTSSCSEAGRTSKVPDGKNQPGMEASPAWPLLTKSPRNRETSKSSHPGRGGINRALEVSRNLSPALDFGFWRFQLQPRIDHFDEMKTCNSSGSGDWKIGDPCVHLPLDGAGGAAGYWH